MSADQQQNPEEPDKLDLGLEPVQDLEVDEQSADAVRGGPGNSGHLGCLTGIKP